MRFNHRASRQWSRTLGSTDSRDFVKPAKTTERGVCHAKALNRGTIPDPPFADIDLRLSVRPGHGSLLLVWLFSNEPGAEAHRGIVTHVCIRHQAQGPRQPMTRPSNPEIIELRPTFQQRFFCISKEVIRILGLKIDIAPLRGKGIVAPCLMNGGMPDRYSTTIA